MISNFRLILLLGSLVHYTESYEDDIPDPDFVTTSDKTDTVSCPSHPVKLPGYFNFIIREILKRDLLSDTDRDLFESAESTDPQSLCEIILGLIPDKKTGVFQQPLDLNYMVLQELPSYEVQQLLVVLYIITMFTFCYSSKRCRNVIISFHFVVFYLYAVYSKINKQYGGIKGGKMAAIANMPSHCKEELGFMSFLSFGWSKLQIGDKCKKFHQQVLTDPRFEIEYLKCFVYPLVSVFSVPLAVLGEELGPFLENVLTPFPFHLQIFVLVFVSVVLGGLVTLMVSVVRQQPSHLPPQEDTNTEPPMAVVYKDLLRELHDMRSEIRALKESHEMSDVRDIMLLNHSAGSIRNTRGIEGSATEMEGSITIIDELIET